MQLRFVSGRAFMRAVKLQNQHAFRGWFFFSEFHHGVLGQRLRFMLA